MLQIQADTYTHRMYQRSVTCEWVYQVTTHLMCGRRHLLRIEIECEKCAIQENKQKRFRFEDITRALAA